MNKIGREGGGEHVYAVGQLSIGERARARENTRRGTRQRNRESASVREREGCSHASNGCAISSHVKSPGGLAPASKE